MLITKLLCIMIFINSCAAEEYEETTELYEPEENHESDENYRNKESHEFDENYESDERHESGESHESEENHESDKNHESDENHENKENHEDHQYRHPNRMYVFSIMYSETRTYTAIVNVDGLKNLKYTYLHSKNFVLQGFLMILPSPY